MEPPQPPHEETVDPEEIRTLVEEVLRVGFALSDLLSRLLDDLADDAFPGRNPAEVLTEMVVGSLQPVADSAGAPAVREATALVGAILDRVLAELRLAAGRGR